MCNAEQTVYHEDACKTKLFFTIQLTKGPQAFDVDTRAVLGALHAGVGHTHLSAITSTLNIPSISHVSFKTRELVTMTSQLIHTYAKKFPMTLKSSLISFIQNGP